MFRRNHATTFCCFSPPVMLATFIIETSLLIWVLLRHGLRSTRTRLASVMLVSLALFQLAEYNVCGRFNLDALAWSRIGFVAITLLPPLGAHLLYVLVAKKERWAVVTAYVTSAAFIYLFAFSSSAFNSHICAGNYAIFQLRNHLGGWYFVYYYYWLLFSVVQGLRILPTLAKSRKQAVIYLLSGYLFFLIPTTVANMVKPETINGIPSVMCGFAVLYALVLVFGILPIKLSKD